MNLLWERGRGPVVWKCGAYRVCSLLSKFGPQFQAFVDVAHGHSTPIGPTVREEDEAKAEAQKWHDKNVITAA